MAISAVQVNSKTFVDPTKFIYSPVELESDTWFFWLKDPDVKSFHYESDAGKFTARKEQRSTSTNEYWYAYRKVGGKLRKVYLAALEELTSDRLEQAAREISQPGWEFYSSRKSYTTKKIESCVTPLPTSQSYPSNDFPKWVTVNPELGQLRVEVQNLQSQLADRQTEIWELQSQLADRQTEIWEKSDEAKSISVTLRRVINYLENIAATGRLTQRLRDGLKPESILPLESIIKKLKRHYD